MGKFNVYARKKKLELFGFKEPTPDEDQVKTVHSDEETVIESVVKSKYKEPTPDEDQVKTVHSDEETVIESVVKSKYGEANNNYEERWQSKFKQLKEYKKANGNLKF